MLTKKVVWLILFTILFLVACSAAPTVTPTLPARSTPTASQTVTVPSATQTALPTIEIDHTTPTPTSDFPTPSYPTNLPGISINPLAQLGKGKAFVRKVVLAPDGRTYAISDSTGLNIFDTKTKQKVHAVSKLRSQAIYYSPNSRLIAALDYGISLIEVDSGKVITSFPYPASLIDAAFSADSQKFAYAVEDCPDVCKDIIHVWDIITQEETFVFNEETSPDEFQFKKILFDRTGKLLLAVNSQDEIDAFDLGTGAVKFKLSAPIKAFDDFLFSKDGKYLASYAADKEGFNALVWRWDTKERFPSITAKWDDLGSSASKVHKVDFSADGSQLEVMLDTHATIRYRFADGTKSQGKNWTDPGELLAYQLQLADDTYNTFPDALSYSPDGQTLAVGSKTGPLRLWDVQTQKIRSGLDTTAKRIQYNHKGNRLVVLNETDDLYNEISIWDVTQNKKMRTLLKKYYIDDFAISPDDSTLAIFVSEYDQTEKLTLWDLERGVLKQTLYTNSEWHQYDVLSYTKAGDFLYLAQASYMKDTPDGHEISVSIHSWDIVTNAALPERIIPFPFPSSYGFFHLWAPQDDKLVISWSDGVIKDIALWDMKTGENINLSDLFLRDVKKINLSTGDAVLAICGNMSLLFSFKANFGIYDLKTGNQLYYFSNDQDDLPIAFNADGSQMAMRSSDGTIVISDVRVVIK